MPALPACRHAPRRVAADRAHGSQCTIAAQDNRLSRSALKIGMGQCRRSADQPRAVPASHVDGGARRTWLAKSFCCRSEAWHAALVAKIHETTQRRAAASDGPPSTQYSCRTHGSGKCLNGAPQSPGRAVGRTLRCCCGSGIAGVCKRPCWVSRQVSRREAGHRHGHPPVAAPASPHGDVPPGESRIGKCAYAGPPGRAAPHRHARPIGPAAFKVTFHIIALAAV